MWELLTAPFFLVGPAAVFWINLVLLRRRLGWTKLACFNCATITGIGAVFGDFFPFSLLERFANIGEGFGIGLAMISGIGLLFASWFVGLFWILTPDKPPEK
jgi:hypothetical protein